ncbi:hypothetical protein [Polaromonas sp.]|uniref:hypothetical protein n=1 Tax=Polaromonas sp. TaxID=1869339 RepID=UPI003BB6AAA8
MKQLIQKAKFMLFEPDEVSETAARQGIGQQRPADIPDQPLTGHWMSAEQQRIQLLESQNQQLRADIAVLKNFSIGFAQELRELLTDVTQLGFSTGARTAQAAPTQAERS